MELVLEIEINVWFSDFNEVYFIFIKFKELCFNIFFFLRLYELIINFFLILNFWFEGGVFFMGFLY